MVMSQIQGTNVAAVIAPFDTLDTYPTHDAQYGKGGYRSVATIAERDAIPTARRSEGMRVRVTADPSPINNTDWDWISGTWVAAPGIASAIAAEESRVAAELARDASLLSRGIFETQSQALSAGVLNIVSLVGGSGGANGTFNIAFSGGAGIGASGRFVVVDGTVVSAFITYTGHSYTSSPTISFASCPGLVGASAVAVIANIISDDEYFSVPVSGSISSLILYKRVAGSGVEITRYPSTFSTQNAIYGRYQLQGLLSSYTVSDTFGLDASGTARFVWTRLYMIVGSSQLKIAAGDFTVGNNEGLIIDLDQTPNGSAEYIVEKVPTFYNVDYTVGRKILIFGNSTGRVCGELVQIAAMASIKNDPNLIFIKHTSGQLNIYVKGSNPFSNRYILYQFQRQTGDNNLSGLYAPYDVWRLNVTLEVEQTARFTFTSIRNITNAGETECAIQQQGKADFVGGQNHGNEVFSTISLLVDGVLRVITATGNYVCKRLELIVNSQLNEYGNNLNKIADKVTRWIFEDRKAELNNRITWSDSITVTFAYLTMVSAYRENPANASELITSVGMREPLYQLEFMSTSGFTPVYSEARQCRLWGNVGISINVDVLNYPTIPQWQFYFANFADRNKIYFGSLANPYTTEINEVWASKSVITIDTRN